MKCGRCHQRPARRKRAVKAADGSALVSCACGRQWTRPAPFVTHGVSLGPSGPARTETLDER